MTSEDEHFERLACLFDRFQHEIYGASALPTMTDIRRASRHGLACVTKDEKAVAIVERPHKPKILRGFAGSTLNVPPGTVLVTDVGFDDKKALAKLLRWITRECDPALVLVRAFPQDPETRVALEAADLSKVALRSIDSEGGARAWMMRKDVTLEGEPIADVDFECTLRHLIWPSKGEKPLLELGDVASIPAIGAASFSHSPAFAGAFPWKIAGVDLYRVQENARWTNDAKRYGTKDGELARLLLTIAAKPQDRIHAVGLDGRPLQVTPEVGGLIYLDVRKPHSIEASGGEDLVVLGVDAVVERALRMKIRTSWS